MKTDHQLQKKAKPAPILACKLSRRVCGFRYHWDWTKIENGIVTDVNIAFTGVSDAPFRDAGVEKAMKGKAATAENIANAASKAAVGISINVDHYADEEYRQHLAAVYAKKALTAACA